MHAVAVVDVVATAGEGLSRAFVKHSFVKVGGEQSGMYMCIIVDYIYVFFNDKIGEGQAPLRDFIQGPLGLCFYSPLLGIYDTTRVEGSCNKVSTTQCNQTNSQ